MQLLLPRSLQRTIAFAVLTLALAATPAVAEQPAAAFSANLAEPSRVHQPASAGQELAEQVEIRRTTHGVPQIKAENLRAAAFALGYAQVEDYGTRVINRLVSARGELARIEGRRRLGSDARSRQRYHRAVETYHLVPADVRDILEGFAEGVNHYIRTHPDEVPDWAEPYFTGCDVAARDIGWYSSSAANEFVRHLGRAGAEDTIEEVLDPADSGDGEMGDPAVEEGSNAFALTGDRTDSGHAILMRNPHLSWTSGYYEAHLRVPGELDFYGDFRIGGPFGIIGGFNRHLGWATTNNDARTREIYALAIDPDRPDHYLFGGVPVPIGKRTMTLEYRDGDGLGSEVREAAHTPLGPVIHRDEKHLYVIRDGRQGQYRLGEQWLRMMRAGNLEEWKEAMRIRARPVSNFTYADRDGNIFYVWNAALPDLPHPQGDDRTAFFAAGADDLWTRLVPFDDLPQLHNPPGGYVRNENDSPHYTNMHQILEPEDLPPNVQPQRLRLRSQHGIELLHNDERYSLEDVVRLKHSMRILLADRVKDDLLAAVRESGPGEPGEEVAAAADLLEQWDNTVSRGSRGSVLFTEWWRLYREDEPSPGRAYAQDWSPEEPLTTPRGLGSPETAAKVFAEAVEQVREEYGNWDVAWGEVHRVRRGDVDVPAGGASGSLGAYRMLDFREDPDGKKRVIGGDAWVLAVEFSDPPRARSILAYGQSNRQDSPHYSDQAEMFAANEMKEVAFTEEEIEAATIRRYRPGLENLPELEAP